MKIYLAGPDVFRPDAQAHGERLKQLCARHGFQGLFPLDAPAPREAGAEAARAIYRANIALLGEADLVMANLAPFRGQEPDSGTAFEVGYAAACGKPVWAYTDEDRPLAQRLAAGRGADGEPVDDRGYRVEDFGLTLNLMLACSATVVHGGPEACLRGIAAAHAPAPSFPESP
ncbi:nucleoside 2-deoxyribosyltransferase [Pigmentiphaga sp. NML080357]|uniref:nucleoside 2-deoxyribosyltransferase n=1 Tax=Pigmentiphaga sp. NML080357 TaxID=2008675 RepID=UPI000B422D50|nr:nucleoside 2-deoxyribosyltransferase [Pigmentiphaga sp. NML080357]OVZ56109.1 nucleoside 2-deoxyribosyltransferase [Pigmentiphaga sp. NML080357]